MDLAEAKKFVDSIDLSGTPRGFGTRVDQEDGASTWSLRRGVVPFLSAAIGLGARRELDDGFGMLPRGAAVSSPLLARMRRLPLAHDTTTGIVTAGSAVRAFWSDSQVSIEPQPELGVWSFVLPHHDGRVLPSPLLIEFQDGLFAATTVLPFFVGSVLRDTSGVAALIYRTIYDPDKTYEAAERAIASMDRSALRATAVVDLAVQLRGLKHFDPVLGVISAYLYDAIGDVDSIRRMASYYVQHGQPIPYDIALLGIVQGEWRANGKELWALIPPVEAREPRTKAEEAHGWTISSMAEAVGMVGGYWPWMRQGWAFLEDPADVGSQLIPRGLTRLRHSLTNGRFATLNPSGGRALAELFAMEPIWTAN